MTAAEILKDITSRNTRKVWASACEVMKLCQDKESISPLIKYLPEIQERTRGLDMGGAFAPSQRFVDFAIRTLQFHRDNSGCPCCLYHELDIFDPIKEEEKGNITILDIVRVDGGYVDYYNATCSKCGKKFKITERDYHYTWWKWTQLSD